MVVVFFLFIGMSMSDIWILHCESVVSMSDGLEPLEFPRTSWYLPIILYD